MKTLVAAALTAVTAVIAGSAIALTPIHAQEIPPGEEAPETSAPSASGGTNLVVFVIPVGLGEVTDAACSLNGIAEESHAKAAMRFGGDDSTNAWSAAGTRAGSQQARQAKGDVGLPDEACNTLRGLFVSLGGQAPQFEATEVGPEDADADEDAAGDDEATRTEDEDASTDDENTGTLTPATGRTAMFVTIFAGSDAGSDGCTLGELVGMSGASVPVVEAGGEETPLQGAADIADVALPADACALLSALFSTLANLPADDDVSVPEDDDAPAMDDDDATPSAGGAATDYDEAEADDEDSTPQATATPRVTRTPSATSTPSGTAPPSATSTPDSSDDEEDEEPLGDEEPEEPAP